ncbi:hypothetical protein Z949_147 [Sulfitobacter guttiformis KCTC 32187]|nr:hypothetical protein Z949_147 [Sulfitobacter guttiformis KCTC 32187]
MAFLKDCTLANSELLAALAALPKAMALFAFGVLGGWLSANAHQRICRIYNATVRADRCVTPKHCLNVLKRCGFVVHVWGGKNGHWKNL